MVALLLERDMGMRVRTQTSEITRPAAEITAAPTQTTVRGAKLAASAPVAKAVAATPR